MTRTSLVLLLLCPAPLNAADEPSLIYRVGAGMGGSYASNVYFNASEVNGLAGEARLELAADWLASDRVIVKGNYQGSVALYSDLSAEHHSIHDARATLGFRPIEPVYLWLDAGGGYVLYPNRRELTFWSGLARLGGRVETGESTTIEASYRFASDGFPHYDLDNNSHRGLVWLETALGDHIELRLPVAYELSIFGEREVLDASGDPTGERALAHNVTFEPGLALFPSFAWRVDVALLGERNESNAAVYYVGPFGAADPTVDPTLIRQFDSYLAGGGLLKGRWDAGHGIFVTAAVTGGTRHYPDRPAFDDAGQITEELQVDTWLRPSLELEWHAAAALRLRLAYAFHRQWSNDALWDFDRHWVMGLLETWLEN